MFYGWYGGFFSFPGSARGERSLRLFPHIDSVVARNLVLDLMRKAAAPFTATYLNLSPGDLLFNVARSATSPLTHPLLRFVPSGTK